MDLTYNKAVVLPDLDPGCLDRAGGRGGGAFLVCPGQRARAFGLGVGCTTRWRVWGDGCSLLAAAF